MGWAVYFDMKLEHEHEQEYEHESLPEKSPEKKSMMQINNVPRHMDTLWPFMGTIHTSPLHLLIEGT